MKTIAIGCDHGAYELKDKVVKHLIDLGYNVIDKGTNGPESVHYPIYAHEVCLALQNNEAELGILLCSTGIGMSMAANKHKGIRAALCSDTYSARLTRMHNDANVLCIGALVVGQALAIDIVDQFVNASFEGGRQKTRVEMFMAREESEK